MKKKKKSFTLIEIVVTVIVVLVLATIAIGGYQKVIDGARQKTSEARILGLHAAIEIYALENGTLGRLTPEYLKRGYARAMKDSDWLTRLSCAWIDFQDKFSVLAASHESPLLNIKDLLDFNRLEKYGAQEKMFTPPDQQIGNVCYAINGNIPVNARWESISDDLILLGEIAQETGPVIFSSHQLARRYKYGREGLAVTKGRKILKTVDELSSAKVTDVTD